MSTDPERIDVPVAGGSLAAYRWPGDGPVVLAAHGITSNHRSWALVAEALGGEATLVAPDLRGRGRSNGLPAPYAIAQHADDCAAVLAHLGAEQVVVAGPLDGRLRRHHAGHAPPRARARAGARRRRPPLVVPPGVDADDALAATLGPAMQRLDMTFADRGAYRAFWQQHPSFAGIWSGEIDDHVQHDLIGEPPEMRSSCVKEAVRVNGRELLLDETVRGAVRDVTCPMVMLWAPRGMVDDPGGLYAEERLGGLEHELVPDTNHYSILLGAAGREARRRGDQARALTW